MSSLNGHHAAGGPSPGGQSSFHPGAYSNISSLSSLRNTQDPSQHMGSSHSKSTHPVPPSSSSVASFKGISAAVAGGIKIKRVFATRRKDNFAKSAEHDSQSPPLSSALSSSSAPPQLFNITSKKSVVQQQQPSSPPPPTPPKHDKPLPSSLHTEGIQSLNRVSILPISPGISPAVNYMMQQQQTPPAVLTPVHTNSSPSQPQPQQDAPAPAPKEAEKVKMGGTTDNMPDKRETKESWRKSDSTNSHHTIRPGGGGASTRTSRPVSWAESFQSTHTVVQSNKRLSALITDGMPEEDDESFVSVGDDLGSHPSKSTPPPSVRVKNRRSMSLNLGTQTISKTPIPPPLASTSVTELEHPSHSISEDISTSTMLLNTQLTTSQYSAPTQKVTPVTSMSVDTGAGQQSQSSTANNIRGRFAAWTAANANSSSDNVSRQDRTLPALPSPPRRPSLSQYAGGGRTSPSASTPTSLRQTTISMTASGLGPAAAGLAKRAVEKMGRKWGMGLSPSTSGSGSGYSSSSSSTNAPSSFSSASHTDYGLVRTSSNQSTPSVHSHIVKSSYSHGSAVGLAGGGGGGGKRRTPDAPSGAYSVHSVASKSDNDPFAPPLGPILGTMLRGGLRSKNGVPVTGGVVFGKELRMVTRETGVNVGSVSEGGQKEGLVLELEGRLLPAVVVRCAQHLLIWGVQEEGLFRVNGRPSHVSKLRSEFDSGVDYDMTECSPGDLDPHAVASIFKAYLRELPESILTQALSPLFDAAIKKEATTNFNFPEQNRFSGVGRGNSSNSGLPQGSKGGFAVRKPPSLTTLAMPTFSGIPPPSTSLVADIRSLISQLPPENYDLLRTVVDLIKATGKESKKTKMPLSNLLLVFCPSLNMTPPLLKVFCEAEDIWAGGSEVDVMDSPPPPPLPLKDGQFEPIKQEEEADMTDTSGEMEDDDEVEEKSLISSGRASLDTTDDPSSGYHASEEEEASLFEEGQVARRRWVPERNMERSEIPTVYLDTRSHYSSSSGSSLREALEPSGRQQHRHMNSRDGLVIADDDRSISSAGRPVPPVPPISSPSPPLCSSSVESVASATSEANSSFSQLPVWDDGNNGGGGDKKVHGVGPVEIVDPDSISLISPTRTTPTKKASISHPIPINDDAVQFPQLPGTPSARQAKRMSIPLLSLPSFSPSFLTSSGDLNRMRDDDSPCPSPTSASGGVNMLSKKSKRPSLRLLFSKNKKSGSSLNSLKSERSSGCGDGIPLISNPVPPQGPYSSTWESWTSDSSGSTPLSAVTAASGMSSRSYLPPVLDTPIEDPSFSLDLRFNASPPETAMPLTGNEGRRKEQQKLAKVSVDVGMGVTSPTTTAANSIPLTAENTNLEEAPTQTPIASRISIVSVQPPPSPGLLSAESLESFLSVPQRPALSLETQSLSSISSAPSPQLSLLDDVEEDEEDWTQSVLSAADKLS